METIKCIKERRTIRRFQNKEIDNEVIKEIISAASYSPSWKNSQTPRYTVIKNKELKDEIAKEGVLGFSWNTGNIMSSQALVVVSYKNGICGYEPDGTFSTSKGASWQMFDAGIATQTFCLAAWDLGIGAVIMGIFDENVVAKKINLPEDETAAVLIGIGYPEANASVPNKKSVDELLRIAE
ncbi:MAG: nitroreductase family protein [Candidatus Gastranaerophilales bacterium]|nr:nitroreductase family protein [Candidatus Gastranaerophilales bacterium]